MKQLIAIMRAIVFLQIVGLVIGVDLNEAEEISYVCGEDALLRCKAYSESGVKYRAVRWYKLNNDPVQLSGLLTRDLIPPNSKTQWYEGVQREVELLDTSVDIILPNITAKDSGSYLCLLAAPIGEENQEGQIHLKVAGCPDDDRSMDQLQKGDIYLFVSLIMLVAALLIYIISYACLRHTIIQRNKRNPQEVLLDKPLEKKDLLLIYTLGSDWSRQPSMKHVCV